MFRHIGTLLLSIFESGALTACEVGETNITRQTMGDLLPPVALERKKYSSSLGGPRAELLWGLVS